MYHVLTLFFCARRREVKDVDFGLTFPVAPAVGEPPPTSTDPHTESNPISARSRTPTAKGQIVAIQPPLEDSTRKMNIRSGNFDANTSAKRRKLDSDAPSSGRSTRSTRPLSVPDIYALPDEEPEGPLTVNENGKANHMDLPPARIPSPELGLTQSSSRVNNTPSPPGMMHEVEEVTESPVHAPGSGHRSRFMDQSLPTSSQLHSVSNSSPLERKAAPSISRRYGRRSEIAASPLPEGSQQEQTILPPPQSEVDEMDELPPGQPTKRPRSRNITIHAVPPPAHIQGATDLEASDELEEAEAIDDLQAAAILKKNRGARNGQAFHPAGSPDLDNSVQRISPVKPSRKKAQLARNSQRQKPQQAAKAVQNIAKKPSKRSRLRSGSPIPVTVLRLTKRLRYDEDELDAEILNAEIPHAKRPGVNAVDVFSQVCNEIIGSGLDTLEEGRRNAEDSELRREYRTKWSALKSFGSELQSRFLTHVSNFTSVIVPY
jgi:hypothetical protein